MRKLFAILLALVLLLSYVRAVVPIRTAVQLPLPMRTVIRFSSHM
jgi:hypothetical protein